MKSIKIVFMPYLVIWGVIYPSTSTKLYQSIGQLTFKMCLRSFKLVFGQDYKESVQTSSSNTWANLVQNLTTPPKKKIYDQLSINLSDL